MSTAEALHKRFAHDEDHACLVQGLYAQVWSEVAELIRHRVLPLPDCFPHSEPFALTLEEFHSRGARLLDVVGSPEAAFRFFCQAAEPQQVRALLKRIEFHPETCPAHGWWGTQIAYACTVGAVLTFLVSSARTALGCDEATATQHVEDIALAAKSQDPGLLGRCLARLHGDATLLPGYFEGLDLALGSRGRPASVIANPLGAPKGQAARVASAYANALSDFSLHLMDDQEFRPLRKKLQAAKRERQARAQKRLHPDFGRTWDNQLRQHPHVSAEGIDVGGGCNDLRRVEDQDHADKVLEVAQQVLQGHRGQAAFLLRNREDLTFAEIAKQEGRSERSVRRDHQDAIRKVRRALG